MKHTFRSLHHQLILFFDLFFIYLFFFSKFLKSGFPSKNCASIFPSSVTMLAIQVFVIMINNMKHQLEPILTGKCYWFHKICVDPVLSRKLYSPILCIRWKIMRMIGTIRLYGDSYQIQGFLKTGHTQTTWPLFQNVDPLPLT